MRAFFALGVALAACGDGAARDGINVITLADSVDSQLAVAAFVADAPTDAPLELRIALATKDPVGLDRLIAAQEDATSAQYHAWLDPAEYCARYGPEPELAHGLTEYYVAAGLAYDDQSDCSLLRFSGSVDAVQAAFHTRIATYATGGKLALANATPLSAPPEFAALILGVYGIDDL